MKHIILDTDIFGDPDDLFALTYALSKKELSIELIVTADEHAGLRAAQTKAFLKAAGESIPVIAGTDLNNSRYVFTHVSDVVQEPRAFVETLHEVIQKQELTEYVCIAPQSNLAAYLKQYPQDASKLNVTVMGSSKKLFFDRVEHNVRLDVPAVQQVSSSCFVKWVLADHTVHETLAFNRDNPLYKELTAIPNEVAKMLCTNIDDFFNAFGYEFSYYHDPLTVSTLISDFVEFEQSTLQFDDAGRMIVADLGSKALVSSRVRYADFVEDFTSSILTYLRTR